MMTKDSSGYGLGQPKRVKLLILGAGPAGLAAALYGARADLEPVVLSGLQPGGQAALTHTIENYPGFPDGVGGPELGDLFQKQAEKFGATIEFDSANLVDLSSKPFKVTSDNGLYEADSLIIATGASPVMLDIPGEKELTGRGVSYCGTCDGWFFKDKKIVVVGGGDSALEEALFLTRYATEVTIVHRRESLRAGAILQKRAKEHPKINFILNSVITQAIGDEKLTRVTVINLLTLEKSTLVTDGLFVFVGHTPNTDLFAGQLNRANGYIEVDDHMRTSVSGVFAAGEAADSHFKQVVTSAGMGAAAAIEATRYLEE